MARDHRRRRRPRASRLGTARPPARCSTAAYEQAWSRSGPRPRPRLDGDDRRVRAATARTLRGRRRRAPRRSTAVADGDLVATEEVDGAQAPTRRSCAAARSRPRRRRPGRSPGASTSPPTLRARLGAVRRPRRRIADALPARDAAVSPVRRGDLRREGGASGGGRIAPRRSSRAPYERAEAEIDANTLASYRTRAGRGGSLVDAGRRRRASPPSATGLHRARGGRRRRCAPRTPRPRRSDRSTPVRAEVEAFARSISQGVDARLRLGLRGGRQSRSDELVRGHARSSGPRTAAGATSR